MSLLAFLSLTILGPLLISAAPIPQSSLPSQTMQSYEHHHEKHLSFHLMLQRIIKLFHNLQHYLQGSTFAPCQSGMTTVHCGDRKTGKEQKAINMSKQSSNEHPGKNP